VPATFVIGSLLAGTAPPVAGGEVSAAMVNRLRSTPENLIWGGFPIDRPPALTVSSGEVVRIDTITQRGATNPAVSPIEYYGPFGVQPGEILPDLQRFWESLPDREGERYGPHVMTGPLYVEGAEPGDTIEIEVLDIDTRVPYGVNSTRQESGALNPTYPGWREGDLPVDIPDAPPGLPGGVWPGVRDHLYRTGISGGEEVAFFNEEIEIPLQPFMGVMAVAPADGMFVGSTPDEGAPETGVQGSGPPGPFGGNLDVKDLTVGSTLYLPVFQEGAQVFMGDGHSAQGDGEVSGSAIEHSLTGTFRVVLHKGVEIDGPWAEDDTHYIMMGIDWDLDRAMRFAVEDTIEFLVEHKGLTTSEAYSMASIAVDYHAAEVVDGTQVITGKIPKSLFDEDVDSR
jgi:acetamidase/formamidase